MNQGRLAGTEEVAESGNFKFRGVNLTPLRLLRA
jgi:hypothetical protein